MGGRPENCRSGIVAFTTMFVIYNAVLFLHTLNIMLRLHLPFPKHCPFILHFLGSLLLQELTVLTVAVSKKPGRYEYVYIRNLPSFFLKLEIS
jgi:hypothetical protein